MSEQSTMAIYLAALGELLPLGCTAVLHCPPLVLLAQGCPLLFS